MDDLLTFLQTSTALWSIQLVVTAIVLSSTSPRSWMRIATLPLLAMYTTQIVLTARNDMRKPWASLIGGSSVCWLLQYFDVAMLKGYDTANDTWVAVSGTNATHARARGTAKKSERKLDRLYVAQFRRAYHILANLRRIGTAQQVKNIPPFRNDDPSFVPSRAAVLKRCAAIIMFNYLALDLLDQVPKQTAEAHALAFHPAKMPFFARIHLSETSAFPIDSLTALKADVVERFVATAGLWATMCALVALVGTSVSFTFVFFGDLTSTTRPVFGNLSDAYGIRQFWGVFYHQYMRGFLIGIATWLVGFTGLRSGVVKRYTELCLAFTVSGLLHTGGDVGQGMPLGSIWEWSTLRFFLTQAAGIMLEDAMIGAWRRVAGRGAKDRSARPQLWKRLLGYAWLAVFMAWSTPGWAYPHARWAVPSEPPLLPFSMIKWMTGPKSGDLKGFLAAPDIAFSPGEF